MNGSTRIKSGVDLTERTFVGETLLFIPAPGITTRRLACAPSSEAPGYPITYIFAVASFGSKYALFADSAARAERYQAANRRVFRVDGIALVVRTCTRTTVSVVRAGHFADNVEAGRAGVVSAKTWRRGGVALCRIHAVEVAF